MTGLLFRKSVFNIRMLFVVAVSFAILFSSLLTNGSIAAFIDTLGQGTDMGYGTDLLSLYAVPFALSSFVVFAGLFPGIPYAYSYLEERNCGYLNFIKIRMARHKYTRQKIFFTGLSGGLTMLVPAVLIFIVLDIMTVDTTASQYPSIFSELVWGPYMFIWGGRLVLILKGILMFLFGVMWSELALTVSLLVRNKYVAFVLPFVIFEMLWIIIGGSVFNPIFLIRADFGVTMPLYAPFLVDIIYILILVILNVYLFKRQEKQ